MSLKTAIEAKQNPEPKKKMFRSLFDFEDVMKEMRPGATKEYIKRMWKDLYHEVAVLDNTDWWIEGHRAKEMETEFLRDREGK